MRLPDLYYTRQIYDGYPEPPGVPAPIQYYTGEDIEFDVLLHYNGKPVLTEDWDITAIVKSNVYQHCTRWVGELNNGIYLNNTTGYYKFLIPSQETANWLPGTYWMDVVIREKLGRGTGPKDLDVYLMRQPFGVDYSVASPRQDFITQTTPEQTAPNIHDIRKP